MDQYLKKVLKIIKLKQETWLKLYDDMNTKLREEAKNDFQKDFFKLMDNSIFGKQCKTLESRDTNQACTHR